MNLFRKRKVVLALGGGSARGFANIGVLKVLEKHKVPIDAMVGSSIGALIAASYSIGMTIEELEKEAVNFKRQDITDVTVPRIAVMKGDKLAKVIGRLTRSKTFGDCRIPVAITATDIKTGGELLFKTGDLQKILRASCSWPGFFPPVRIDGKLLADGGIRNSIPVKWAKELKATHTIAIKIGFSPQKIDSDNIFHLMIQSIQIMGDELDKYQSMQADVFIEPDLNGISQLDFEKGRELIEKGEEAAKKDIKKIKDLLGI